MLLRVDEMFLHGEAWVCADAAMDVRFLDRRVRRSLVLDDGSFLFSPRYCFRQVRWSYLAMSSIRDGQGSIRIKG